MIKAITQCRICGNLDLVPVINLGTHALTGFFPKDKNTDIIQGPLELVKCVENDSRCCGLLQLGHSYEAKDLYGDHYGYRSALNRSMVHHLNGIVGKILEKKQLAAGDIVLDIGSNDGTLLQAYQKEAQLVGIDPAGNKFKKYYPQHIKLIPEFFSAQTFRKHFGNKKAQIITSIAMFYDVESPVDFMKQVREVLDEEGIWVFEVSYMPTMLEKTAYDTICQEHFEYYSLKQIKFMTDALELNIIHVEFNGTNGGSFLVMVAHKGNRQYPENKNSIDKILADEKTQGISGIALYRDFEQRVQERRDELVEFVSEAKAKGKKICGYGASTKGNVILQYCHLTDKDILCIAEVNEDKFGCYTPGTGIPIMSEDKVKLLSPDYLIVLPWHFRDNIIAREAQYLQNGGALVFPLPKLEVYSLDLRHSPDI
jgi:NDP-4-keto-2,6-dideoxyhexose 3-C-methyltransferase